ncbi:MAG: hypothetical protein ABI876_03490 [Bacteroidota bacterium]
MVKYTFRNRWNQLVTILRDNREKLPPDMPEENIRAGASENEVPQNPPFIWVGMIPNEIVLGIDTAAIRNTATGTVLCAVPNTGDNAAAVMDANELAETVLMIFAESPDVQITPWSPPILLDTVAAGYVAMTVNFHVTYEFK